MTDTISKREESKTSELSKSELDKAAGGFSGFALPVNRSEAPKKGDSPTETVTFQYEQFKT